MAYTEANTRVDITIGGVHVGIPDKWSGGDKTSVPTKFRRATGEKVLSGFATRTDGKATFLVDEPFWAMFKEIDAKIGKGDQQAIIGLTPCGDDGTPFASGPIRLTGCASMLLTPPGDFNSSNAALAEIDFVLSAELA